MEVKPWFEWDADQNGHQRPISTGSRLDPYTIEHVISRTFGSSSTYAGLCIAFGTLFAFIGLHLTRHGQGESKNAASSLMKAFVQLITVPLVFWLVGYGIINGKGHPVLSYEGATLLNGMDSLNFQKYTIECAIVLLVGAAISTCAHESNYIYVDFIIAVLVPSILFPLPAAWCYGDDGWLQTNGYNDYGGAGPIFMITFGCAWSFSLLAGSGQVQLQINDRYLDPNLRISESISDERKDKVLKQSGYNVGLYGLAAILQIIGLFAAQVGLEVLHSTTLTFHHMPMVINNLMVASCCSGIVTCFASRLKTKVWSIQRTFGGMLAGMAVVACGLPLLKPWQCAALGVLSALVYIVFRNVFLKLNIHDNNDFISASGINACISLMLVPAVLFGQTEEWVFRIGWNILGALTLSVWSFCLMTLILLPLHKCKALKQRSAFQNSNGLDSHCTREQVVIQCSKHKKGGQVEEMLLADRKLMATPRLVSSNDLKPASSSRLDAVSQTRTPPKYLVSNPRLISTTSNIPVFNIERIGETERPSYDDFAIPTLTRRSTSMSTFNGDQADEALRRGVLSTSALPHPPLDLLRENDDETVDQRSTLPVPVTRLSIHQQLHNLKPLPQDIVNRRPSLSVRREVTPLATEDLNNNFIF